MTIASTQKIREMFQEAYDQEASQQNSFVQKESELFIVSGKPYTLKFLGEDLYAKELDSTLSTSYTPYVIAIAVAVVAGVVIALFASWWVGVLLGGCGGLLACGTIAFIQARNREQEVYQLQTRIANQVQGEFSKAGKEAAEITETPTTLVEPSQAAITSEQPSSAPSSPAKKPEPTSVATTRTQPPKTPPFISRQQAAILSGVSAGMHMSLKEMIELARERLFEKTGAFLSHIQEQTELNRMEMLIQEVLEGFALPEPSEGTSSVKTKVHFSTAAIRRGEKITASITLSPQMDSSHFAFLPQTHLLFIDCSGSMKEENKIQQAIQAGKDYLQYCYENKFPVVIFSFAETLQLVCRCGVIKDQKDLAEQQAKIDKIRAGGGTNTLVVTAAAFILAAQLYKLHGNSSDRSRVFRITLATDGEPSFSKMNEMTAPALQNVLDTIMGDAAGNVNYSILAITKNPELIKQLKTVTEYLGGFTTACADQNIVSEMMQHAKHQGAYRALRVTYDNCITIRSGHRFSSSDSAVRGSFVKPLLMEKQVSGIGIPQIRHGSSRTILLEFTNNATSEPIQLMLSLEAINLFTGKRFTVKGSLNIPIMTENPMIDAYEQCFEHAYYLQRLLDPSHRDEPEMFINLAERSIANWPKLSDPYTAAAQSSCTRILERLTTLFPKNTDSENWLQLVKNEETLIAHELASVKSQSAPALMEDEPTPLSELDWKEAAPYGREIAARVVAGTQFPSPVAAIVASYTLAFSGKEYLARLKNRRVEFVCSLVGKDQEEIARLKKIEAARATVERIQGYLRNDYTEPDPGSMPKSAQQIVDAVATMRRAGLFFAGNVEELNAHIKSQIKALAGATTLEKQETLLKTPLLYFRTTTRPLPRLTCVLPGWDLSDTASFVNVSMRLSPSVDTFVLDRELSATWAGLFNCDYPIDGVALLARVNECRQRLIDLTKEMQTSGCFYEGDIKLIAEVLNKRKAEDGGLFSHDQQFGKFVYTFSHWDGELHQVPLELNLYNMQLTIAAQRVGDSVNWKNTIYSLPGNWREIPRTIDSFKGLMISIKSCLKGKGIPFVENPIATTVDMHPSGYFHSLNCNRISYTFKSLTKSHTLVWYVNDTSITLCSDMWNWRFLFEENPGTASLSMEITALPKKIVEIQTIMQTPDQMQARKIKRDSQRAANLAQLAASEQHISARTQGRYVLHGRTSLKIDYNKIPDPFKDAL